MRLSGSPLLACKSHSARLPPRAARPSPRSLRWPTTPPCAPSRRRTQRRRRGESSPQRTGSATCTGSRRLTGPPCPDLKTQIRVFRLALVRESARPCSYHVASRSERAGECAREAREARGGRTPPCQACGALTHSVLYHSLQ